jgi:DNA anti-recombination protein RmuC
MREQADVIQAEVGLLLQDATRLDDRVGALERHFNQTVDDVRKIRISTDKVMRRGERIGELQLESKNPEAEEDGTSELPFSPPSPDESAESNPASNISQISGSLRPPR